MIAWLVVAVAGPIAGVALFAVVYWHICRVADRLRDRP
jgi:hypothetical protein